jgi:hypothetical protein
MSILLKKILGSFVRYIWIGLFSAPIMVKILTSFLDEETIEQIRTLGAEGGPVYLWVLSILVAIYPLLWSWYQKAMEVAKRWIAAKMPDGSLPKVEVEAKSLGVVEKLQIATNTAYPTRLQR